MAQLTEIEGIGAGLSEKLSRAGAGSVEKLLAAGQTRAGRKKLAQDAGVDEKQLLRFVNHADLMRIKGIGGEYSDLLEAAGVDSVPELAQRNAANLHKKLVEVNEAKKLVRSVASEKQVAAWVAQAASIERMVTS